MFANLNINYVISLIKSTGKKSFENLSRICKIHPSTLRRSIPHHEESLNSLQAIAKSLFKNENMLVLAFDDSKIRKNYSKFMQGAGKFFDEKIGRRIMAFKIIVAGLTNGKIIIPIHFQYLFAPEYSESENVPKFVKADYMKQITENAQKALPSKEIVVAADGLFATVDVLRWLSNAHIKAVLRFAKNRKVLFKGQEKKLSEIHALICNGRYKNRTIQAVWHGMNLYFTAVKRMDKHGETSIIYLVSTFVKSNQSYLLAELYKKRWLIETLFRTTKQSLGLEDCFSRILEFQKNHVASVFLAYGILQIKRKIYRLKNPEEALKRSKHGNALSLKSSILALDHIFNEVFA